jgi:hypothetical protein
MTISAQSLVLRVVDISQDKTSIRWPVNEVIRALNDAQREVVMYRPDAMVTPATLPLVAGAKQALPSNGLKLIDVPRNTSGNAVRLTNREILDAQMPSWYTATGVTNILHYMYDVRDPKVFYVYPPAAASGASLEITYSAMPTDVPQVVSESAEYTAVTGNIGVPDIYANALVDFMLYKIYLKDADYAGNTARSQAHYTLFVNALGAEVKATAAVAPKSKGNPNASDAGAV